MKNFEQETVLENVMAMITDEKKRCSEDSAARLIDLSAHKVPEEVGETDIANWTAEKDFLTTLEDMIPSLYTLWLSQIEIEDNDIIDTTEE